MNREKLILAVPAKGRLMEHSMETFANFGLPLRRAGHERGYRGRMDGLESVEVMFLSASEIAVFLGMGRIHMGLTGEDLIREHLSDAEERVEFIRPLAFGRADVVVAVPDCWVDVHCMRDIEEVAAVFYREHGRRLRVATKYMNLTRRFFADSGITGYRIVESLGATEGTPSAGTAEMIVDITSTGATLRANHLKILDDGVILRSQATLAASRVANWTQTASAAREQIEARIRALPVGN